jgi:putative membrane protein
VDNDSSKASFSRLFQIIVLLAWIAAFWFLLQRIGGNPALGKFLRPDYWWLVEAGAAILVIFLISLVYCNPHNHGRRGVSLLVQIGIMILPLLYLPTAVMSHLSPEAAKKRSFHMAQSARIARAAPTNNSGLDLPENTSLLNLVMDPDSYEGKRVITIGMVYWDDNLPEKLFLCYQLLMSCCAADARPIGVLVEYDMLKTLNKGDWVTVEGVLGSANIKDKKVIRISAEKVVSTEPPKDQYLFQ